MKSHPECEIDPRRSRPVIAIGNYDFRPSGTVAKLIEIAAACAQAGFTVELWVVRAEGSLLARVPYAVKIVSTGSSLRMRSRALDLVLNVAAMAAAFRKSHPAVFLSGGNHLHLAARMALALSGRKRSVRFETRASNSAHHGPASSWRSRVGRWNNRLKFGGADFIAAVSQALGEEIRGALPSKAVKVIPNGVDVAEVTRLASTPFEHPFIDEGGPLLVTMGRIVHQRGSTPSFRRLPVLSTWIRA